MSDKLTEEDAARNRTLWDDVGKGAAHAESALAELVRVARGPVQNPTHIDPEQVRRWDSQVTLARHEVMSAIRRLEGACLEIKHELESRNNARADIDLWPHRAPVGPTSPTLPNEGGKMKASARIYTRQQAQKMTLIARHLGHAWACKNVGVSVHDLVERLVAGEDCSVPRDGVAQWTEPTMRGESGRRTIRWSVARSGNDLHRTPPTGRGGKPFLDHRADFLGARLRRLGEPDPGLVPNRQRWVPAHHRANPYPRGPRRPRGRPVPTAAGRWSAPERVQRRSYPTEAPQRLGDGRKPSHCIPIAASKPLRDHPEPSQGESPQEPRLLRGFARPLSSPQQVRGLSVVGQGDGRTGLPPCGAQVVQGLPSRLA